MCHGYDDRKLGEGRCWGAIFDGTRVLCKNVPGKATADLDGVTFHVHFLNGDRGRDPFYDSSAPSRPRGTTPRSHSPAEEPRAGGADPTPARASKWKPEWDADVEAIYSYAQAGVELYQVVRRRGKKIMPRHRRGGDWWCGYGVDPQGGTILYRQDDVTAALAAGDPVYICEGEKDVDRMVAAGAVATTNPGGTGLGFRPQHAAIFGVESSSRVVVVADKDEPGLKHACFVREALVKVGVDVERVELVRARNGKDAHDHLEAGGTLEDFLELTAEDLEPFMPAGERLRMALRRSIEIVTPDGLPSLPPPREFLVQGFLPAGIVGLLVAAGGTGKGFFSMGLSLSLAIGRAFGPYAIDQPSGVLLLSKEDDSGELHRRFYWTARAYLGAERHLDALAIDTLRRHLHLRDFVGVEPTHLGAEFSGELAAYCRAHPEIRTIIVDPIGKLIPPEAPELNSQEGAGFISRELDRLRSMTGCTVIGAHHVGKGRDHLTAEAATGSRQLVDFARWCFNLKALDPEEGETSEFNLEPDGGPYVVGRLVKSNYTGAERVQIIFTRGEGGALIPSAIDSVRTGLPTQLAEVFRRHGNAWLRRDQVRDEFQALFNLGKHKADAALKIGESRRLVERSMQGKARHHVFRLIEAPDPASEAEAASWFDL